MLYHYLCIARRSILFFTTLLVYEIAPAALDPAVTVKSAATAKVVINPNRTIRAKVPAELFSVNMQNNLFERQHWDRNNRNVVASVRNSLAPLSGNMYRYPGGLAGNSFNWEASVLPYATRLERRRNGGNSNLYAFFGVGEYLNLIKEISNGTPSFTLNLVGAGSLRNPIEWSSAKVAESNKRLALYIKNRTPNQTVRYYNLGNELDRNHYQWSHNKYINRSRDTINAILSVDPQARFLPFMREFTWRYRYPKSGSSKADVYFRDVMTRLPMIKDFSLHYYYDGKLSPTAPYVTVPKMATNIDKALRLAKNARPANYSIWITEHAKRFFLRGGTPESATSLSAAISVGDFLLTLMQIPEVKGAMMQGLEGGSRELFYGDRKPTSPHWTLRVLASQPYPRVLASQSFSPNSSGYKGGYDIRAVGFTNAAKDKLGVSAINRSPYAKTLRIEYPPLKGKTRPMKHYVLKGAAGVNSANIEKNYSVDITPGTQSKSFSSTGVVNVSLPPSSVSTLVFL